MQGQSKAADFSFNCAEVIELVWLQNSKSLHMLIYFDHIRCIKHFPQQQNDQKQQRFPLWSALRGLGSTLVEAVFTGIYQDQLWGPRGCGFVVAVEIYFVDFSGDA